MKNKKLYLSSVILVLVSCSLLVLPGCNKDKNNVTQPTGEANALLDIDNVIPSELGSDYIKNFNRYTSVSAPNGGVIHIVAQSEITTEQIVRCRSILQHFLKDYIGSEYGSDKSSIANKMADNNAKLLLLNGEDDGSNAVEVDGQWLFHNEIQVEGHSWYMNQDYKHRDAAYEEILHLVHDYGIGVDGKNSQPGAVPLYQSEIRSAQQNALSNNLWGIDSKDWIEELTSENSLSQEYLASLIDSYYGLWGAWSESTTHGMWGIYVGKTRTEIEEEDPQGNELLQNKLFHPYITYNARIDSGLTGDFSMRFDPSKPYTHHSQYLKDITLLGSNNNSVIVNQRDNDITGNEGSNTVILTGSFSEYTIATSNSETTITDDIPNRDGNNRMRNIEKVQFEDQTINL